MKTLRDHSLSLFFLTLFAAALVGQAIAGHAEYNNEAIAHSSETLSFWSYVVSPDFGQAVMENWQSEYLQFTLFIMATVWFVQKGSPESKEPDKVGLETDEEQQIGAHARADSPNWARARGFKLWLYSNSLLLVMGAISWAEYLTRADFWERTLQNWQSEFLAVGSMAIFAVYLRQRGSPESKPVGAPHDETAATG